MSVYLGNVYQQILIAWMCENIQHAYKKQKIMSENKMQISNKVNSRSLLWRTTYAEWLSVYFHQLPYQNIWEEIKAINDMELQNVVHSFTRRCQFCVGVFSSINCEHISPNYFMFIVNTVTYCRSAGVLIDQNFCGIGIEHRALQSPKRRTNVWKQDTMKKRVEHVVWYQM